MNLAGFMGVGVSILAFAACHRLLGPSLARTLAAGLLVVAGVGMVVVGFLPCDAGCVDVTGTSRLHLAEPIRLEPSRPLRFGFTVPVSPRL